MQVDDEIIHCTAFLGQEVSHGFAAEGTCFFLAVTEGEHSFPYLVSARHVVRPFSSDRDMTLNPAPIWVRAHTNLGRACLIETPRRDWVCHPDRFIDICVYPFYSRHIVGLGNGVLHVPSIALTPEAEEYWGFGLGREVFIPSVFTARVGERHNIPVVRVATVAAMPLEPVDHASPRKPAYLIETKSLGGTSGAPVFFHTNPHRIHGRPPVAIDPKTGHRTVPYF